MVYDSNDSNSFSYLVQLIEKYETREIPIIFISTKSDLDLAPQRCILQPDNYCRKLGLAVPFSVSVKNGKTTNLFETLARISIDPDISTARVKKRGRTYKNLLTITAGIIGVFAIAWGAYRYHKTS